jgi:arsenate reductase (thioredoxin)
MPNQDQRIKVLFLCTGNACRSQMAEGFARALKGGEIEAYSAGVNPAGLDPRAVLVMAEAGVDISFHRSKRYWEIVDNEGAPVQFDHVVTVCGHAQEACPAFPGHTSIIHRGFDDPPTLAGATRSREAALECYRRVRDEIRAFIETLPQALQAPGENHEPA